MKKPPQNGYNNTTADPMFRSFKEMQTFMQDLLPPSPKPKVVEHVVLDADDTIWQIEPWGIASLANPVGHTDKDELPVELIAEELAIMPEFWGSVLPTGRVNLDPTLRATLDKLEEKSIPVSIASINAKPSVMKYLEAFGLKNRFAEVEANYTDSKGKMVQKIANRQKVATDKILFVNDSYMNALDVVRETKATSLIMGYNIAKIADIMEFIK